MSSLLSLLSLPELSPDSFFRFELKVWRYGETIEILWEIVDD